MQCNAQITAAVTRYLQTTIGGTIGGTAFTDHEEPPRSSNSRI